MMVFKCFVFVLSNTLEYVYGLKVLIWYIFLLFYIASVVEKKNYPLSYDSCLCATMKEVYGEVICFI